jgi:hypothetical protein
MVGYLLATAAAALATLLPATSHADALHPRKPALTRSAMSKRHWPTFSPVEGAATVAANTGTAVLFSLKPPHDPRWDGGILFDDDAPLMPLVIDPVVASWLARSGTKTALNLELIGVDAYSYAGLLSFVSTRVSRRQRTDAAECRPAHDAPSKCARDTESVYSAETTIADASAGLVCADHRAMPPWGHPTADAAGACALATTAATTTGIPRIASERHDRSDVLAGLGTDFDIGYAMPTLLHYTSEDTDVKLSISPGSPCTGACLKLAGSF